MTLEKAIEIQSISANAGVTTFDQDFKDSQRLGIEAMHRVKEYRFYNLPSSAILLPGETPEKPC